MTPASDNTIKFNENVPVQFCPKAAQGRAVSGLYGPRFMFTAVDGRKAFVDGDEASALEEAMRKYRIRPGEDFITVTKIKHGRSSFLKIEPADEPGLADDEPPAPVSAPRGPRRPAPSGSTYGPNLEAKLAQSVELARQHGPAAFISPRQVDQAEQLREITTAHAKLLAALMCAVDCALEAQNYAASRGAEIHFSEESIRCMAATLFINEQGGR
jgi:hypothetical protein